MTDTFNPFFNYLIAQGRQHGQLCAKAHHANKSMDVTHEVYGNRIINEGLSVTFQFCVNFKRKVCTTFALPDLFMTK